MKYAFTVAALLALVSAQGITDLPHCSLSCILTGVGATGCEVTDFKCACEKANILTPSVTPCVQKACSDKADRATVIKVLEGICASAGVPITIPNPDDQPSSAPPASSSTKAPEPAPSSSTKAPEPVPSSSTKGGEPAPSSTGAPPASTTGAPYPIPSGSSTKKPTGTSPPSSSTSSPAFTGAASAMNVPAAAAGVFGLLAYVL